MNAAELVSLFGRNGIELKVVDGKITYEAVRGFTTPELIAYLKNNKQEIIDILTLQSDADKTLKRRSSNVVLASFAQQRLWFLNQLEAGSAFYNMPAAVRLTGKLDVEALRRTLNEIVRRHEALRTRFASVDGAPTQIIAAALELALPLTDLSELPAAEAEGRAQQSAQDEARTPFDLEHGPLIRAQLIRLGDREHIALLTMHHIVSDDWSIGVLIKEIAALYAAYSQGRPSPLPELLIQYADYAHWQRQWLQGAALEGQLGYWKEQLADAPTLLALPTDRPRPAVQRYDGGTLRFAVSRQTTTGLNALARQAQATLFMTLAAAFNVLLSRYAGQDDICVGTSIANRPRPEVEGLIGFFVNTLVLRTRLAGNPSFKDLLMQVRSTALAAYAHQDVPFEQLVEELKPQRHLSHAPLFQVMLVLQNAPMEALRLPGLRLEGVEAGSETAKFDLTLMAAEREDELRATLTYNTSLFDAPTIERMAEHFTRLLDGIVEAPETRIAQLPMLSAAERHQVVAEWNATAVDYEGAQTLHELFEAQVAEAPDAVAVAFEGRELTYGELNARSNQLAHYLRQCGVGPEVLVGLCVERSLEMVVGLLGVLKAGGAYVPLDPSYPPERLAYMLDDAKLGVLVTQAHLVEALPAYVGACVCVDADGRAIATMPTHAPRSEASGQHLAYVTYTSGSTGRPKGVMTRHASAVNYLRFIVNQYGVTAGERVLQIPTLSFDASVRDIFGCLSAGGRLRVMTGADAKHAQAVLEHLRRDAITAILSITPSFLEAITSIARAGGEGAMAASSLRLVLASGEALSERVIESVREVLGAQAEVVNQYGPTECTMTSTYYRSRGGEAVRVGRAIDNVRAYVLDAAMAATPVGVSGELYIGGAGLSRGYLNRPDLTAERFVPNPFAAGERLYRSGDRARWTAQGQLDYLGRLDDQVKIRGFRIELGEVEAVLAALPGVGEAIVAAREDEPGERRLVAYVTPRAHEAAEAREGTERGEDGGEGDGLEEAGALRAALLRVLPDYMVPSHFVALDRLPLTPNGKIDRKALPAPGAQRGEGGYAAPRTPAETAMAQIWAKVLKLDRVGIHDNFFEHGGDSLRALVVLSRMRKAFDVELPLRALFEAPTVAQLAQRVEQEQRERTGLQLPALAPVGRGEDMPLSFAQQRLWFLNQLEAGSAFYNMPAAVRLTGKLDVEALRRTLNEIVRRHEALRTRFASVDGAPTQIIAAALELALPLTDLSELPAAEAEGRAQQSAQDEARTPFDLEHGPLIRAQLIRLGDREHIALLTMHHIVSDDWSIGVLIKEIAALYAAYSQGRPSPLPELLIQYADYAHWQRQWLQGAALEGQLGYWKEQLADAPTLLALPTDRPRPAVQRYDGGTLRFAVSRQTTTGLNALARQAQATLFMTLAAAFNVLLSRYAGQDDICVGTSIANRPRPEVEGLIGFFVNTLVLRTRLAGNPSFKDLLMQVRSTALAAYAHQDVPFEQLVEELKPQRHLSHAPLFQVMLVLQNAPMEALRLPGLRLEGVEAGSETAKFDLTLMAAEREDELRATLTYNTSLFDAPTIERMAEHFTRLLDGIVEAPETRIAQLPMLSAAERHQVVAEWNATAVDYEGAQTLHELFEAQVAEAPDAVAVAFEGRELTYGELNARSNQLAHYLRQCGVGPEVLVGLCVERSLEMVVGLLGVLKAGGAYVPLDPSYPPERLAYMLDDARPAVLLTQAAVLPRLPGVEIAVLCLDVQWPALAECSAANPARLSEADHLAYVIYTSGSTGRPKGVGVPHAGIVNRLNWMQEAYALHDSDRILQKTPFSFDVSVWELFWPLLNGSTLVMARPGGHQDADYLSRVIAQQAITTLHFVPPMLEAFLNGRELPRCATLKRVICSGQALPLELQQRFFKALPHAELHNLYGPTEASVDVTFWACDAATALNAVPIGRPIANTQLYILDELLNPAPVGVAGELHIAGAGLARGYLQRPDLTAEKFIANPFGPPGARMYKSGDLARYLPDGAIEYLGRLDDQVKIRGFRIELGEVEAVLAALPGVGEAIVAAREDEPGERRLVAYVTPRAHEAAEAREGTERGEDGGEGDGLEAGALRAALLRVLPDYMVPSHFVALDRLPLTPNGKIDRKALPAPGAQRGEGGYAAPRTPAEAAMAQIWAEVLKLDRVGIHDNFFELGGHSMLAVKLIEQMRKEGFHTDVRALFIAPTLAELTLKVSGASGEIDVPLNGIPPGCEAIAPEMLTLLALTSEEIEQVVGDVSGGAANVQEIYPLAPLQEGILFHHLMNQEGDAYLLSRTLRFDAREQLDRFLQALQRVIDRHDILRTAVHWENLPEPVQVVWRNARLVIEEVAVDARGEDAFEQLIARHHPRRYRFDIRKAPLIRCFVAQDRARAQWLLQIFSHHLISDHATLDLLIDEIGTILRGLTHRLPAPHPFRNFVAQARSGVSRAANEAFFKEMLADVSEPTAPFGLLEVRGDGLGIEEAVRPVNALLSARIRQISGTLRISAASVVHAAWAQVLSRISGRHDVVFGTVLFGRMHAGEGLDRTLGMFINTLPVRIRTSMRSVQQSVQDTHRLLGRLLQHEHASLALAQRCSGVVAPAPLFSTLLNYRHGPDADTRKASNLEWALEGVEVLSTEERTNYPCVLSVDDLGTGFILTAQIGARVGAERLCDYMHTVLENLVQALEDAPQTDIARIEVLAEHERTQLVAEWNATAVDYEGAQTLHELFEAQVAEAPDAVAVAFEGRELTYGELNARSNQLAHYLRQCGVGPEVLVGLCVERSLEMVVGLLGVLKAGGAYVPLDPSYPPERLAYMLDDARPAVLLTQAAVLPRLPGVEIAVLCLDVQWPALAECSAANPARLSEADHLAYVIYTSGSTGRPKGVGVPHAGIVNRLNWMQEAYALHDSDRILQKTPFSFDVSVWELFWPLLNGSTLVMARPGGHQDADYLSRVIAQQAITTLHFVPPMLEAFLNGRELPRCATLKRVICSGQALPLELQQRFFKALPHAELHNLYGPTEASVDVTFWACDAATALNAVPIGRPIANTQLYILDELLNPAPVGVAGELHIAGAGLARGYLQRPDLTAEKFIANPFGPPGARMYKSGDLARYLPDGAIEYLGRLDDQVKIRGFRIELGEVEAVLAALPGVGEAIVAAREDEPGERRLVAYVTPRAHEAAEAREGTERGEDGGEGDGLEAGALRAALLRVLPDYMVPSHFVALDRLPLTPNGKIDRKALPAPGAQRGEGGYAAPRTPAEAAMAQIWAEVLKLDRVGIHDNFFELGGHSILAMQAIARVQSIFDVELPLRALFEAPTVAQLAQRVDTEIRYPEEVEI
ncbi:MAG: amino acid adenylation domain-containing protein [Methylocella sp.]